jgi:hypothetical protein
MSVIKMSSGLHLSVSTSIVIFGIGVPPIWQGVLGMIFSMEGYHGVASYNTTRVKLFILGLIFSIVISCAIGVLAVLGTPLGVVNPVVECENGATGSATLGNEETFTFISQDNPCAASYQMFGFVELLSGVLSITLFFVVTASFGSMKRECQALKLAKENDFERFFYS